MICFCIADLVSNQSAEGLLEDCDLFGPARDDVLAMAVKMANVLDEPGQDLEADFPKSKSWVKQTCRAARVAAGSPHCTQPTVDSSIRSCVNLPSRAL